MKRERYLKMIVTPDVAVYGGTRSTKTIVDIRFPRPHLMKRRDSWFCLGSGVYGEVFSAADAWCLWVSEVVFGKAVVGTDRVHYMRRIEAMRLSKDVIWKFLR